MDDKELRQLVIEELDFEPSIDSSNIGVAATGGVITLTGHVGSYAEKTAAEKAAKRVRGVQGVAQEIEVRYPEEKKLADDQIAKRALDILAWNVQLPAGTLQVTVSGGWVTLTGEVDWYYQKQLAEISVRKLSGVTGISNLIRIVGGTHSADVKLRIENALRRSAELAARNIHVEVANGRVTLTGTVSAWNQRRLAEDAAWAVPGVHAVEDNLRFS
jgi:osmotically-inducible protein OsmY